MKTFLNRVTITGPDDTTKHLDLVALSNDFPFVEWGILLSKSKEGGDPRYPSASWINRLKNYDLRLSGHLCGRWVRDLVAGQYTFFEERRQWASLFQRIQMNISNIIAGLSVSQLLKTIDNLEIDGQNYFSKVRPIIQTSLFYDFLRPLSGVNGPGIFDFLLDGSGGLGLLPNRWPAAIPGCGYAGGLTPENLDAQLQIIAELTEWSAWIDVESGVRTNNYLDLKKVRAFLEIAAPYVINGITNANHNSTGSDNSIGG